MNRPEPFPRGTRRTSRRPGGDEHDDGAAPERLGATLERLVRHLGWGPRTRAVGVIAEWEHIVGPAIAAHASAVASDGTTLVVAVDDPAWATQLRWLEADLLGRLEREAGVRFERIVIKVRGR